MKFASPLLCAFLCLSNCSLAQADLIVNISNTTIESGGTGSVDVFVHSNMGDVNLSSYSLVFGIGITTGAGTLQFQDTFDGNANRQTDSERSDPNYIFVSDLGGSFSSQRPANTLQLTQADSTSNAISNTVVVGATPKLVATLELEHIAPPGTTGVFELSLVDTFNTRFFSPPASFPNIAEQSFATSDSNAANGTSFTNFGTITVAAVPEPCSLFVLSALSSAGLLRRNRRS